MACYINSIAFILCSQKTYKMKSVNSVYIFLYWLESPVCWSMVVSAVQDYFFISYASALMSHICQSFILLWDTH